jgi:hypothetical protein
MTIPFAVNFGVSQRAPQQTLPRILGIEAGKSAEVVFAQSCPQFRGGLPPGVLRRVREYIEAHLEKNVGLEVLAGIAVCRYPTCTRVQAVGRCGPTRLSLDNRSSPFWMMTNRPGKEL